MNIRKVNLNLLIALDALLTMRNVSRAAEKIFITQPALSNALTQLRTLFNDQLLVRTGRKMVLTPLAVEIAPEVKQVLEQIEKIVSHDKIFNPQTDKREFRVAMSDYAEFVLLPTLAEKLTKIAPNIRLKIIHANMLDNANLFVDNKFDLGIGVVNMQSPFLQVEPLFTEEAICAAHAKHPFIKKLTLKNYLEAKHLAIAYQDESVLAITDTSLKETGLQRNVVLAVPHMLSAMYVLAKTSLISTVPKRLATSLQQQLKLAVHKPPFKIPNVTISMVWHKRFANDAGHRWLRNIFLETAKGI